MKPGDTLMKHYLQFSDSSAQEYAYWLFERTKEIKKQASRTTRNTMPLARPHAGDDLREGPPRAPA